MDIHPYVSGLLSGANVKCLQSTPTSRREALSSTPRTGKILRKLVQRIVETIPEVQSEAASYNLTKYKMKGNTQNRDSSLEDEECLTMMMGLKLFEKEEQQGKENTLCIEAKNILIGNGVQATMRITFPAGRSSRSKRSGRRSRQLIIMSNIN